MRGPMKIGCTGFAAAARALLFLLGMCTLFRPLPALCGTKIHLDHVPYVVQKERLD